MEMKQKILITLGLMSGLALFPLPAIATLTDPRPADDDIVVTGIETTKDAIADFIQTTIATPKGGKHQGQHARFSQPVCPKVVGLSEDNQKQVEQRMRGVAIAADMKVAEEGCAPNVYVMVVADGNEAIAMLRKKRSRLFTSISHYERDRIAKSGGPAYAWKRIQAGSAETGVLQNSDDTEYLPTVGAKNVTVPVLHSKVKSRIKQPTTLAMTHSFLLLEKDALVDLTTVQIADYAAMRTYIDIREGQASKAPAYSILALCDSAKSDEKRPESASEMDLALLSSLYNSPADVSAAMQSSAMLHRVEQELTAGLDD